MSSCSALAASRISAQDNYEIQVYGSDLVPVGATMFELHSNFTTRTGVDLSPGMFSTYHAVHETLEITHGFTDFFELGYYNFTSVQPGEGFNWVGTHLRPRFSVPETLALAGRASSFRRRFGYQRKEFSPDTWTWEFRPIIDQKIGRFYWSINPGARAVAQGRSNSDRASSSRPTCTVGFDVTHRLNFALEYYGNFGPLSGFDPVAGPSRNSFPAINYDFGPDWEFNLGVGMALTRHRPMSSG